MTGYLDANCLIRYKGFLSEVQIIVSGIYSLKGEQTPLYNLARSLGLVGPLQPEYAMLMEGAAVGKDRVRPPRSTRVLLVALRAVAMLGASFPSMFYPWFCFLFQSYFGVDVMAGIYGIQLRLPVWTVYGLALAIPNLILGYLTARDIARVEGWPSSLASTAVVWFFYMVIWAFGGFEGADGFDFESFIISGLPCIISLLWMLSAVYSVHRSRKQIAKGTKMSSQGQRVGMLYNRYLGIRGKFFVWKVAIVQLVTLSLQASSKLKLYGQGATLGVVEFLRGIGDAESGYIFVRILYALFLLGLVVNAIYPAILLRMSSIRLQRELSAVTDVVLDCVYILTNVMMVYTGMFAQLAPIDPRAYLSNFWPLLHIFSVCRAVEAAVTRRMQEQQAKKSSKANDAQDTRLPRWGALLYLTISMGMLSYYLHDASDFFPFASHCGRCSCRGGVLLTCTHLTESGIVASNSGITAIRSNAFDGMAPSYLDLSRNALDAESVTVLKNMSSLTILDLRDNDISELPADMFDGLPNLRVIFLTGNPVACSNLSLSAGTMCSDAEPVCHFSKCSDVAPECGVAPGIPKISTEEETDEEGVIACRDKHTPLILSIGGDGIICAPPHRTRSFPSTLIDFTAPALQSRAAISAA
eukprot:Transcript_9648.p1 GENE.Transcript_9648~~Transcript_9648.p1  ORF type:complete len:711 (-),score=108.43 Transcript_9648:607-2526(-)